MMRKLLCLAVATGMLLVAASANASVFLPLTSTIKVKFGALPTITINGAYGGGFATLLGGPGAHTIHFDENIWDVVGVSPGTSLFTGVPLITDLTITVANPAGWFSQGFSAVNLVGGNLPSVQITDFHTRRLR